MAEKLSKMERYILMKGVGKQEAFKMREAQWRRYYQVSMLDTNLTEDEWVTNKMTDEGWF